jgi:hypothetical protein
MLRLKWGAWIGLLCVVVMVGCTDTSDRPATVKVTGTVTYNGEPVPGATVAFSPKAKDGHAAAGTTDASGKFTLSSFGSGDGAVPGSYYVGVSKFEGGQVDVDATGTEEDPSAAYEAMEKAGVDTMGGGGAQAAKNALPDKYMNPVTSELDAEVTEGGKNQFEFALED